MGAKKRPYYRVVVADQRAPRDGRFIENIGKYHPLEEPSLIEIDEERALHWLRTGAQPSEQVQNLLNKVGIWEKFAAERPATAAKVNSKDKKVREGKPEAAKTSKKAQKKAVEAAAAPPAEPEPKAEAPAAEPAKAETPEPEPESRRRARRAGRDRRGRGGDARARGRRGGDPRGVRELLEFLARELVDDPDAVEVVESSDDRGPVLTLTVAPDDMGKVIGRGGRTARAIRAIVRAAATRQGIRSVFVEIAD